MVSFSLRDVGLRLKGYVYPILFYSPTERSEVGRIESNVVAEDTEEENPLYERASESILDRSPGTVCVEQPGLEGIVPSQSIVSVEEALAREFFSLTASYAVGRRR